MRRKRREGPEMLPEIPIPVPPDAIHAVVSLRDRLSVGNARNCTVGVGLKQVGREYTDQIAICVHVKHKKPVDEVAEGELVPPEFASYVTDVVETRPVLIDDNAHYDPLCGGIQISRNSDDGVIAPSSGTLGAIVINRHWETTGADECSCRETEWQDGLSTGAGAAYCVRDRHRGWFAVDAQLSVSVLSRLRSRRPR